MYLLQNTQTKQYFCEFSEQLLTIDTKDINEAADFHTRQDADRLKIHLNGKYKTVPKASKATENRR